jgi:hypothetical protein
VRIQGDLEEIDVEMKDAYVPVVYRILYAILALLGIV